MPALHGPVAPLEQYALVVGRLLHAHRRISVAFDHLPHGSFLLVLSRAATATATARATATVRGRRRSLGARGRQLAAASVVARAGADHVLAVGVAEARTVLGGRVVALVVVVVDVVVVAARRGR